MGRIKKRFLKSLFCRVRCSITVYTKCSYFTVSWISVTSEINVFTAYDICIMHNKTNCLGVRCILQEVSGIKGTRRVIISLESLFLEDVSIFTRNRVFTQVA